METYNLMRYVKDVWCVDNLYGFIELWINLDMEKSRHWTYSFLHWVMTHGLFTEPHVHIKFHSKCPHAPVDFHNQAEIEHASLYLTEHAPLYSLYCYDLDWEASKNETSPLSVSKNFHYTGVVTLSVIIAILWFHQELTALQFPKYVSKVIGKLAPLTSLIFELRNPLKWDLEAVIISPQTYFI